MIDETFLAQHRATLVRDQDGWLLRYPLQGRSFYDERPFNLPIETTVPLVGETREDSLQMAELLLRDHKPPKIPAEPAEVQQTPPAKFAMRRSALILRLPEGGGEIVALRIRGKGNFLLTKSQ